MSLFGSRRDFRLLRGMNRELLQDIVQQEVAYYKISLEDTQASIYGEAMSKTFYSPLLLNCLITRGDQTMTADEFGGDLTRESSFAFLRDDLVERSLVPEVGDVVMWQEDYYEIDNVTENELFWGKDPGYNLGRSSDYGTSVSIVCRGHLTRADKLGILPSR
jgi:hypothetical protein